MLKLVLIAVGLLATALGAIGVVLPVLPTTPFLLLAVFCFARSSARLKNYLINHRIFGRYLSNYYHHAMTPKDKARTLTILWIGIVISCLLLGKTVTWIVLPIIASLVSIHLLRLQPNPDQAPTESSESDEDLKV